MSQNKSFIKFGMIGISLVSLGSVSLGAVIEAKISNTGVNRIEFKKGVGSIGIAEIVGDERNYQLFNDHQGSNVFITPKVKVGASFSISVIGNNGEVAELELTNSNIGSQVITINDKAEHPTRNLIKAGAGDNRKPAGKESVEAGKMLRAMRFGIKDKYYVIKHNTKAKVRLADENIELIKEAVYRWGQYTGVILAVKKEQQDYRADQVATPRELAAADFTNIFAGTIIVSLSPSPVAKGIANNEANRRMQGYGDQWQKLLIVTLKLEDE